MTPRMTHVPRVPAFPAAAIAALLLAGCSSGHIGDSWQCPLAEGGACDSVAAADPAVPETAGRTMLKQPLWRVGDSAPEAPTARGPGQAMETACKADCSGRFDPFGWLWRLFAGGDGGDSIDAREAGPAPATPASPDTIPRNGPSTGNPGAPRRNGPPLAGARAAVRAAVLARHDVAVHGDHPNHPRRAGSRCGPGWRAPAGVNARVDGPFLFLGIVARGEGNGAWDCRAASVHPILSEKVPMPVDSATSAVRSTSCGARPPASRRDAALADALGGPARVELEKPLFQFVVRGGPCRPDAILTVTRPGGAGRLPAGPDGPLLEGPFQDRDTARYVVEVMGSADPKYERRKENTHARMRRIGRLIRMEGRQFDSSWNDLEIQTRGIARRIGKDLIARWKSG